MTSFNADTEMKQIKSLSKDEFVRELKAVGLFSGPVSNSTRKILEKRLLNYRSKLEGDVMEKSVEDSPGDADLNESICSPLQNVTSGSSLPCSFYGVFSSVGKDDQSRKVFNSQKDALKAMKHLDNARFKQFSSLADAENFAKYGSIESNTTKNIDMSLTEPISKYKSLTTQHYSVLKESIEKGDIDEVKEKCKGNPLYLISRMDAPSIVQEGCRYNPIHVAVKANQLLICQYILQTISDELFWKDLYPEVVNENGLIKERIDRAVDLYLNTPDKIMSCSPLHFACSLGHVEIVEYLVSFTSLEKHRINKYGESPSQVICSNYKGCKSSMEECKEKITELLKGRSIVPIFERNQSSLAPEIGEPIAHSIETSNEVLNRKQTVNGDVMRAFAGPMSPAKAKAFFHNWKRSPKKEQYIHVALSDYDKGFERIGRELAFTERIPWKEYWPFLRCYADLSNIEGLKLLEQHFKEKISEERLGSTPSVNSKPTTEYSEFKNTDDCKRNLLAAFDGAKTTDILNAKQENTTIVQSQSDALLSNLVNDMENLDLSTEDVTNVDRMSKDYFILGDGPTKLDMDVYRAVTYANYNRDDFPLIKRWISAVDNFTLEDRNKWPTPAVVRFKSRMKELRSNEGM